jgi:hypothetical protein
VKKQNWRPEDETMRIGLLMGIAGVAAFVSLGASGGAANAELRVMESTASTIEVDAVFQDGAAFNVPAGKKIKLLKSPANTTHEIAGPYNGTLEAYTPACGMWDRVSGKCSQNNAIGGGSRGIAGTTRGLTAPKQ